MTDRLTPLLTFVRIVDSGSLSAAARAMERSLPAVCRSLAQLEERLGARLLNRTTRRIGLTEPGAQFYERCRRVVAELEEAEASVTAQRVEPQGRLSIAAPLLFGRMHVAPAVTELLRRHPKVTANLALSDRVVNLVEEGIDVAVRIGRLADSSLVARPLGAVPRVVCAAPAYLEREGTPRAPAELERHACIRFTDLTPGREWPFAVDGVERRVKVGGPLVTNNGDAAIAAAAAGLGLVMVLGYQVESELERGTLVRVLREHERPPVPVQAVYPSGRLVPAKLRVFLDVLAATVAPRLDALAGSAERRRPGRK
jgi:DNA-binding transcriptional LysR family regulator